MKTGAIKVCPRQGVRLNQKHEAIKKCKVGKVAIKYFERDFVEK